MGKIRVLPEVVANKIAAGEVVERPASVVKELMENSLDADAKNIFVSIQHGGKSRITVKDDGHGMDSSDAVSCFQRHATSKITDVHEIERICTLGFRGEALPSIASVSETTIITRRPTDETATRIEVAGGIIKRETECSAPAGTMVETSNLFFNTPARRKFLKSETAESNAVTEVFNSLALSRIDISFSLTRNNREAVCYPACKDIQSRIKQIFTPDYASRMYDISVETPNFKLSGCIGSPDNTRVNRTGQKIFINKRPVYSPAFSTALMRAYEEFIPQKRFPVAVLFLQIEASYVDVNVHPAKREVRIREERSFQNILIREIKKILNQRGFYLQPTVSNINLQESISSYKKQGMGPADSLNPAGSEWQRETDKRWRHITGLSERKTGPEPVQQSIPEQATYRDHFGIKKILGQVLDTYIITETNNGMLVLDQHAAHERILYEEILDSICKNRSASQNMIFPVIMHLSLQEAEALERYMSFFQDSGFSINSLGGNSFSVDATPVFLQDQDTGNIIKDTLHDLMEKTESKTWQLLQQNFAAILACKTLSIKAGRQLYQQEIEDLLQKLSTRKNPHTCPHGRPTFFIITKEELEKRFKRN